ncbi:MAG: caspase family protein [Nitrospinae bacterium]|nr:caspase family protein [Nitrospinota bacterium]
MWVKLKDIEGSHTLRWDWISPDKNIYFKTQDIEINSDSKKHDLNTAVHRIGIRGEKSEKLTGEWQVHVYLDNYLITSRHFNLLPGIGDIDRYITAGPLNTVSKDKTKWAIIIGIEKYRNVTPALYANRDASLMKEYINKFAGIPEENIFLLTDDNATKNGIEILLDRTRRLIKEGDTVYFYYAGHGIPDVGDSTPYILPSDGDPDNPRLSSYPLDRLYKDLNDLKAKNIYVFIDACFSGMVGRQKEEKMLIAGRPGTLIVKDPVIASEKIALFAAARENQISNFYKEEEHGLFTYYLLKGMVGEADINKDRQINIEELYKYISGNVESVSRRLFGMNRYQVPVLKPYPVGREINPVLVNVE